MLHPRRCASTACKPSSVCARRSDTSALSKRTWPGGKARLPDTTLTQRQQGFSPAAPLQPAKARRPSWSPKTTIFLIHSNTEPCRRVMALPCCAASCTDSNTQRRYSAWEKPLSAISLVRILLSGSQQESRNKTSIVPRSCNESYRTSSAAVGPIRCQELCHQKKRQESIAHRAFPKHLTASERTEDMPLLSPAEGPGKNSCALAHPCVRQP